MSIGSWGGVNHTDMWFESTRKHTEAMMQQRFNLMTEARRDEEEMGYH